MLLRFRQAKFHWTSLITADCKLGAHTRIMRHAKLVSSNVENDFMLGPNAVCSGVNVGNHCSISENSLAVNSQLDDFVKIGKNGTLYSCRIGSHSYFAQDVLAFHMSMGNFCSIGPRVIFGHGDHPHNRLSTSPEFYTPSSSTGHSFVTQHSFEEFAPIELGHDIWIGANAYIKHGVKIGNGAIVASGAVVTKDVAPYAIVGGVPAKELKKRFSDDIILQLQELAWWHWPLENILANSHLFAAKGEDELRNCFNKDMA